MAGSDVLSGDTPNKSSSNLQSTMDMCQHWCLMISLELSRGGSNIFLHTWKYLIISLLSVAEIIDGGVCVLLVKEKVGIGTSNQTCHAALYG